MTSESLDNARRLLEGSLSADARSWFDAALSAVTDEPSSIRTLFPAAGRMVGRDMLDGLATVDLVRVDMLSRLGQDTSSEVRDLYHYGDADERRSLLVALDIIQVEQVVALDLIRDALRSNDTRLVHAALGVFGLEHLDDSEIYNAVLKCIFMEIPLGTVGGLQERITPELSRMVAGFVLERVAAGRDVSPDVWSVIDRFPPEAEIAAIEAELHSTVPERRAAAERALALRNGLGEGNQNEGIDD